jgi:membrane protein implicated in regulation of membrane protease activity
MSAKMIVWACISLALIAAETMAPGIFLLWLGFAAAAVFLLVFVLPGMTLLMQVLLFVVLSFVSVGVYVKFFRGKEAPSDQPLLNRRGEQLVDKVMSLETAIINGQGRVKIGDAFWTVQGPDLPANTLVRVISVDSMTLRVIPAE